jgi:hypothetical protein
MTVEFDWHSNKLIGSQSNKGLYTMLTNAGIQVPNGFLIWLSGPSLNLINEWIMRGIEVLCQ